MPIYEYECRKCGHRFEVMQSFNDKPIRRCEECRGRVDKLISPAAVIYKGSGFYTTDYARATDSKKPPPFKPPGSDGDGEKKDTSEKKEPAKAAKDD
ncbi:MAG: FmdB family zinc ribbon protein [Armatimonadota bacterium]